MYLSVHSSNVHRIAKLWSEPRCPLKKMWSIYTMEYYSAIRKDEYPMFASTWMGLEIMLGERSQAEKVNYHMVSLTCGTQGLNRRTLGDGELGEIGGGEKP